MSSTDTCTGALCGLIERHFTDNPPPLYPLDMRADQRYEITIPVSVQAVDDRLQAQGEPFGTVTLEMSSNTLSFVSPSCFESDLVVLHFANRGVADFSVLAEVLRWQSLHGVVYQVAARVLGPVQKISPKRYQLNAV